MRAFPLERDSLAVRPFAGTRGRLGNNTIHALNDSAPTQATPAGEPSPGDSVANESGAPTHSHLSILTRRLPSSSMSYALGSSALARIRGS
jgi:hypothetical protein